MAAAAAQRGEGVGAGALVRRRGRPRARARAAQAARWQRPLRRSATRCGEGASAAGAGAEGGVVTVLGAESNLGQLTCTALRDFGGSRVTRVNCVVARQFLGNANFEQRSLLGSARLPVVDPGDEAALRAALAESSAIVSCFEDGKLQLSAVGWILAQWEQTLGESGEAQPPLEQVVLMSRFGTERAGDLIFKAKNAKAVVTGQLQAYADCESLLGRFVEVHGQVRPTLLRCGNLVGCGPFAKVDTLAQLEDEAADATIKDFVVMRGDDGEGQVTRRHAALCAARAVADGCAGAYSAYSRKSDDAYAVTADGVSAMLKAAS